MPRPSTVRVRRPSISENTPPSVAKGLKSRLRTTGVANRRRLGTVSNTTSLRTPQYLAEQAKLKKKLKVAASSSKEKTVEKPSASSSSSTPQLPSPSSRCQCGQEQPQPPLNPEEYVTFHFARVRVTENEAEIVDAPTEMQHITLPRRLGRFPVAEVSQEALEAVMPAGRPVPPPHYVRERLQGYSSEMWNSAMLCKPLFSRDSLPSHLPVQVPDNALHPPSHILAIQHSNPATPVKNIKLFPAHSIVLAAHCTNLPPFEPHTPAPVLNGFVATPTRNIQVPSPDQFPPVLNYLYLKQKDTLLRHLLAVKEVPHLDTPPALRAFATHLGRMFTSDMLMTLVLRMHGMWSNVLALGVFEEGLWETMDKAWEVLVTAMAVAEGQPQLMLTACKRATTTPSTPVKREETGGTGLVSPPSSPAASTWYSERGVAV